MPPLTMLIKPASSLCNMRCQYCFYADVAANRAVPSYGLMDLDTLELTIRRALEFAEGHCTFAFQGGEPTLAGLAFFHEAVALQAKHNARHIPIYNTIQTNGLAITDEWADFFREHKFLVGLSLDGDASIHNDLRPDAAGKGTYNRVVQAATCLARHHVAYNILCVVTKPVALHGTRVYGQLKRHRHLQFIPCIDDFHGTGPLSLTPDIYLRFLKATFDAYYHDFMQGQYVSIRTFDNYVRLLLGHPPESCAMNGQCACTPVVESNGGVFPCDFYVLDAWYLGNLRDEPLNVVLTSPRAQDFVASSLKPDPQCIRCEWYGLCRGGCRRDREIPGADGLGRNRFCDAYKAFFPYSIDRLRLMAHATASRG